MELTAFKINPASLRTPLADTKNTHDYYYGYPTTIISADDRPRTFASRLNHYSHRRREAKAGALGVT